MNTLNLSNQYGEVSQNEIIGGSEEALADQNFSNALPSKTGVTAIGAQGAVTIALATSNTYTDAAVNAAVNAALATVVAKLNAVLAAMKVVS